MSRLTALRGGAESISAMLEKTLVHVTLMATLVKIVLADNQTNLCQDLLTIENTQSDLKVDALHYANELLVRIRLAFQKLLQTRQTSRNYQKQVLVMIKHCLGNSQINSIPACRKEFSYITFLYRTNAKVYEYN